MSAFILTCSGTSGLKYPLYGPEGPPRPRIRDIGNRETANDNILAAGHTTYFGRQADSLAPILRRYIEEFPYKKIIIVDFENGGKIRALKYGALAAACAASPFTQGPLTCDTVVGPLSAMIAYVGGVDVLVLAGGEHQARRDICSSLGWLQLKLGDNAYLSCNRYISLPESAVAVLALGGNERQLSFTIAG